LETKKQNITIKRLPSIAEKNKNARSSAVSDLGGTDGLEAQ
jgi:hypothetical protein